MIYLTPAPQLPALFHASYHSKLKALKVWRELQSEHEKHVQEYNEMWHGHVAIQRRMHLCDAKNRREVYWLETRIGLQIEDEVMYWAYEAKRIAFEEF